MKCRRYEAWPKFGCWTNSANFRVANSATNKFFQKSDIAQINLTLFQEINFHSYLHQQVNYGDVLVCDFRIALEGSMQLKDYGERPKQFQFGFSEERLPYSEKRKEISSRERYLLDTLIEHHRLRKRTNAVYFTLRKWDAKIKNRQLLAMRSVKREPSRHFIDTIAAELATFAAGVVGLEKFECIVPIPGGSSQTRGFSSKICSSLAVQIDLPVVEAFHKIETKSNSSHPKNNAMRSKMRLKSIPRNGILLIDDIATSGAHLKEAINILKPHCPSIFTVAWVGS